MGSSFWDERRRKIACLENGMCVFDEVASIHFFLERSDVWDYSEAFTKRYILLIFFWLSMFLPFLLSTREAILLLHATNFSLEIPSHFYSSFSD